MCCLFLCGRSNMDLRTKQACEINYIDIRHIVRHLTTCFPDPFEALYQITSPPLPTRPRTQRDALTDLAKGKPLLKREALTKIKLSLSLPSLLTLFK